MMMSVDFDYLIITALIVVAGQYTGSDSST